MTQLFFQSFCTKKSKIFHTKRWLQNGQNNFLLSKNGLRIAVGGLVKLLEKCFLRQEKKKLVLSKNGLRIAVGRLVKLLEKLFLKQANKS